MAFAADSPVLLVLVITAEFLRGFFLQSVYFYWGTKKKESPYFRSPYFRLGIFTFTTPTPTPHPSVNELISVD